jgi:ABC-2 type transport system permease protein
MRTAVSNPSATLARKSSFGGDVLTMAGRALRSIPRDPESVIPGILFPAFFFAVNIGAFQDLFKGNPEFDFKAFQVPVAIVFAVTGISRAMTLVLDIQGGYFDRLGMTPVARLALLLGLMVADFAMVMALTVPVLILGFAVGVRFETGLLGVVVFVLLAGLWGLVFAGFPYSIALKTGSPAAVNMSFLIFMPFVFLAPTFIPREAMTSWLAAIATYNPVTYLLAALRSLILVGWDWTAIVQGLGAVLAVGVLSFSLALWTLRGRVTRR